MDKCNNTCYCIYITVDENDNYHLTIFSIEGKKLYDNLNTGVKEINSGLNSGIYFIKVKDSNISNHKLMIEY